MHRLLPLLLLACSTADPEQPTPSPTPVDTGTPPPTPVDSDPPMVDTDPPPVPLLDAPPPITGGYTDITPAELRDLPLAEGRSTTSATFCRLDEDPALEVLVATTLHGGFGPVYEVVDGTLTHEGWTLAGAGLINGPQDPWALGCIDLDNDGIDEILQTQTDRISTRGEDGIWRTVDIPDVDPLCDDIAQNTHAIGVDDLDGNGLLDVVFETSERQREREGCALGPIIAAMQTAPLEFRWTPVVTPQMWQRVWAFRMLHDADPPALLAAGQLVPHHEEATGWYVLEPGWTDSRATALSPYDDLLPRRNAMGLLLQDLDGDGAVEQVDSPTEPQLVVHTRRDGVWTDVSAVSAIEAPFPRGRTEGQRMFPWAIAALHISRRLLPDLVVNHGDDDGSVGDGLFDAHHTVAHYHRGVTPSGVASFALWPTDLGDLGQDHNSRSVSTADIDGDGDQDLLIGGAYGDGIRLYRDDIEVPGFASTTVRLRGQTNGVGSGARITARLPDGRELVHWVAPGGTTGAITTPEWSLGMEDAASAELDILWPSGTTQSVTVQPGTYLEIIEP